MVLGLKPKKQTEENASCLAAMQCAANFYKVDVNEDMFWKRVGKPLKGLGAKGNQ